MGAVSFDILQHDRLVQITPITTGSEDDYGNIVPGRGEPYDAWTRRDQLSSAEEVIGRDQQARMFRYFFDPEVAISGRDEISDDGKTLQVIGEPERVRGQLTDHHVEALAELIEG